MTDIQSLFLRLWDDYCRINPQAAKIHGLLRSRGDTIHNDHIALRTFDDPRVNIEQLSTPFVEAGYLAGGQYRFEEKRLSAVHFEHPDPSLPKVFISELLTRQFSEGLRSTVGSLLEHLPKPIVGPLCAAGRPWPIEFSTYQSLQSESEYAAWMSAHGFCANHFTIDVNRLDSVESLSELNRLLSEAGFVLNEQGGSIKGSPAVFLEQSSTMASKVIVDFLDGPREVPGCYYEFAKRYPTADGTLFGGFVTNSADKIFESTDQKRD